MIVSLKQLLFIFCILANCCLAKISNIVVFGDSYSDVGNRQQSSNGPVWSQDLAVGWNASLYSFAFNGATCDRSTHQGSRNTSSITPPTIVDQIEIYYQQKLKLAPEDTIYAFWVGYTDIHNMVQTNSEDYEGLADCIIQQIRNVRKVFETNRFITFTLAPLENMPYFSDGKNRVQKYKQAMDKFNGILHEKVFNLVGHHQSLELDLVDAHDLLKDMTNAPTEFGFKDGHHSFWDHCQGQCSDSVDDYIWWDKTHLTGGAHRVIANSILASGSMEPPATLVEATTVHDLVQAPGSRFASPHYKPKHNTGIINRLVKELNAAKEANDNNASSSTEETGDVDNKVADDEGKWIRPLYFGALLTVLLCVGFVLYNSRAKRRGGNLAALSGLVRNRNSGRGQFTPLRNLETPSSV
ncbi:GDSL-like Lipase/Acylhydrolase-domain-containing protein [Absidia repens]|uniref:GDSL-like Lipase/Acylhydrolase-domain-containing protein n=1 Tax=Absidia repens TaxID=90262 RepID=A0A1X2IZ94_9FUNG|nr:GDSL-like Lipase/Acylhydrolase-domain-containing protein [Absidia repens]